VIFGHGAPPPLTLWLLHFSFPLCSTKWNATKDASFLLIVTLKKSSIWNYIFGYLQTNDAIHLIPDDFTAFWIMGGTSSLGNFHSKRLIFSDIMRIHVIYQWQELFSVAAFFSSWWFWFFFISLLKKDNIYGTFVVCSPEFNSWYSINNSMHEESLVILLKSSCPFPGLSSQVNPIYNLSKWQESLWYSVT